MFRLFCALFLSLLLGTAAAAPIPNFPGWKLERAEKDAAQNTSAEGVSFEYADYFALYPNDQRPPITIDGGTARRLLQGQVSPETIYGGRGVSAAEATAGGNQAQNQGAVGWQQIESSYVPLSADSAGGRNPTSLTSSSTYAKGGALPNAPGTAASSNGFSMVGAANFPASAGAAVTTGGITAGNNSTAGGGDMNVYKTPPTATSGSSGNGDFTLPTGNLTYSQMIEAATSNANQSACARMGRFAPAGQCGGR